jgi:peroxiredoxin-like protein
MKPLPHRYGVTVLTGQVGRATLLSGGVPDLETAPPLEFDGPGDVWSPEQLLLAAVNACFALTFRAIAAASTIEFTSLAVDAEGIIDRQDGRMRFTEIVLRPRVTLPAGQDPVRVRRALEKAERGCPVSASLGALVRVEPEPAG